MKNEQKGCVGFSAHRDGKLQEIFLFKIVVAKDLYNFEEK